MQSQHMRNVWNIVDRGEPFPRSFKGQKQEKLVGILRRRQCLEGAEAVNQLKGEDYAKINKALRRIVSPIFRQANNGLKLELGAWVIHDWGGIGRLKPDVINQWIDCLSDFEDKKICEFIEKNGNHRISSWSKLLSFLDPEKYAIYDSRTAFALNFALNQLGDIRRFTIPASQNKEIKREIPNYQYSANNHQKLEYFDYLDFLASSPVGDILSAEMMLFSNALRLVKSN